MVPAHSRTFPRTIAASWPWSGETMEPWLSEASRPAVSCFSAGTSGATADRSSVFAKRSSVWKPVREPSGLRAYVGFVDRVGLHE